MYSMMGLVLLYCHLYLNEQVFSATMMINLLMAQTIIFTTQLLASLSENLRIQTLLLANSRLTLSIVLISWPCLWTYKLASLQ